MNFIKHGYFYVFFEYTFNLGNVTDEASFNRGFQSVVLNR